MLIGVHLFFQGVHPLPINPKNKLMKSITMKILFLIARNRINKSNKCAIKCRITYAKQRKEFSTGLFVSPDNWNSKKQKVLDKGPLLK